MMKIQQQQLPCSTPIRRIACLIAGFAGFLLAAMGQVGAVEQPPLGPVGGHATYVLETGKTPAATTVQRFTVQLGSVETRGASSFQWLELSATKSNGETFRVWLLANDYPSRSLAAAATNIARYIFQEGGATPKEFVHRVTGNPVLPTTGAWEFLWPRPESGEFTNGVPAPRATWLGQNYTLEEKGARREAVGEISIAKHLLPPAAMRVELLPDVLLGVPSNSRTKDNMRRFDGSDYEMVRLTRDNYAEMIRAGMNCFRVDAEQAAWLADEPVFIWGVGGKDVPYPECLFRSTWIGPSLFFDEPAVHTRDYIARPKLDKYPAFRKSITPQIVFGEFTNYFHETVTKGAPWSLIKQLRARPDVDLGTLNFPQRNLYSWETMIASATWQLMAETNGGPAALVFEPPGRVGARRTLPEMNMAYGCQIPADNPTHLADLIFGFLRGAARATDKDWGVSIYGGVDQADAPLLLTHAYDLGATHFFFWDCVQTACVPYGESLALARHLQAHVQSHPVRDIARLKRSAEVAILLPPGYDLGHVHMGRGNFWGLGELNLERTNHHGIPYRKVMGNFFTEIERCVRLGVPFDLMWNLDGLKLDGYREVVRVREDGRVEISTDGRRKLHKGARVPERPADKPPQLVITLSDAVGESPRPITARARVTEGSSPVYHTTGADSQGVYHNSMVLWELYGPGAEDYRLLPGRVNLTPTADADAAVIETQFIIQQPGHYRLRAATTDLAGRSTVVWKEFNIGK